MDQRLKQAMQEAGFGPSFGEPKPVLDEYRAESQGTSRGGSTSLAFFLLAALLVAAIASGYHTEKKSTSSRAYNSPLTVEQEVADAVRAEQVTLPKRLNDVSFLTSITASGKVVTYQIRLETTVPLSERPAFRHHMTALRAPDLCRTSAAALNAGVEFRYAFIDASGFSGSYSVSKAICEAYSASVPASSGAVSLPPPADGKAMTVAKPDAPSVPVPSGSRPRAVNPFLAP